MHTAKRPRKATLVGFWDFFLMMCLTISSGVTCASDIKLSLKNTPNEFCRKIHFSGPIFSRLAQKSVFFGNSHKLLYSTVVTVKNYPLIINSVDTLFHLPSHLETQQKKLAPWSPTFFHLKQPNQFSNPLFLRLARRTFDYKSLSYSGDLKKLHTKKSRNLTRVFLNILYVVLSLFDEFKLPSIV